MRLSLLAAAALCVSSLTALGDTQVIVNGGFESGSLSPFTTDTRFGNGSISVSNTNCFDGNYCADVMGNVALKQTFTGTATSAISDVSFEVNSVYQGIAYDFFYSDGGDDEFEADNISSVYSRVDATSNLRAGATLTGFEIFGFFDTTVPTTNTYIDNVGITANTAVGATPEPSSFALLGTGLLGIAGVIRKRFA